VVESKDMTTEEPEELPVPEEAVEPVPELAEPVDGPVAVVPVSPGRRAPGTKEVIPFRWKLVGESSGFVLTLFKAIEREDVEAQLERVRIEGYYVNLRIMDVNEKVVQPPSEKPPKAAPKAAKAPPPKPAKPVPQPTKAAAQPPKAPSQAAKASPQPTEKPEKIDGENKAGRVSKPRAPAKVGKTKPAAVKAKSTPKKAAASGSTATKKRSAKKK